MKPVGGGFFIYTESVEVHPTPPHLSCLPWTQLKGAIYGEPVEPSRRTIYSKSIILTYLKFSGRITLESVFERKIKMENVWLLFLIIALFVLYGYALLRLKIHPLKNLCLCSALVISGFFLSIDFLPIDFWLACYLISAILGIFVGAIFRCLSKRKQLALAQPPP